MDNLEKKNEILKPAVSNINSINIYTEDSIVTLTPNVPIYEKFIEQRSIAKNLDRCEEQSRIYAFKENVDMILNIFKTSLGTLYIRLLTQIFGGNNYPIEILDCIPELDNLKENLIITIPAFFINNNEDILTAVLINSSTIIGDMIYSDIMAKLSILYAINGRDGITREDVQRYIMNTNTYFKDFMSDLLFEYTNLSKNIEYILNKSLK